ncbi:MAG: hypothetical protein WC261_14040 [Synergistaceae bacterium]
MRYGKDFTVWFGKVGSGVVGCGAVRSGKDSKAWYGSARNGIAL